jgi:hypothetical protein
LRTHNGTRTATRSLKNSLFPFLGSFPPSRLPPTNLLPLNYPPAWLRPMAGGAHRELCSGERAVVLLFVFRVALSVPSSLFLHASALCLLSLAALFVEISVDCSSYALQRFKTRLVTPLIPHVLLQFGKYAPMDIILERKRLARDETYSVKHLTGPTSLLIYVLILRLLIFYGFENMLFPNSSKVRISDFRSCIRFAC